MPKILSTGDVKQFRQRLCDLALQAFADRGIDGISLRGLAADAGCSRMTPKATELAARLLELARPHRRDHDCRLFYYQEAILRLAQSVQDQWFLPGLEFSRFRGFWGSGCTDVNCTEHW